MTEEIIIDGCNVKDCDLYSLRGSCMDDNISPVDCKDRPDCEYKQLQRLKQENEALQAQLNNITVQSNNIITALEQENEELKILKDMYLTFYKAKHDDVKGLFIKYRSALEEIREIAKDTFHCCDDDCGNARKIKLIIDKINEVLK